MKSLEQDIIRATESEIVLSDVGVVKWIMKFLGLMMGCAAFTGIGIAYDSNEYFIEALGGYCFSLCVIAPMALAIWQIFDRVKTIQFNQPLGYITVKESPWWSVLIPFGPSFIKVPKQVPLPKSSPFVVEQFGSMTYPVQTGPEMVEIRQAPVHSFTVQLPLDNSKVFTLWTTSDQNTYVEIIGRINKAIQDFNQMKR